MTSAKHLALTLTLFVFALAAARPVTAQSVTSLTLIDADTDAALRTLADDDVIDLSTLATSSLNVRADAAGSPGSIRFAFAGQPDYQTENAAPFALGGDTDGDYDAVPELSQPGTYTLTATPYPAADAGGTAGTSLTVQLEVVDGGGGGGGGGEDGDGSVTLAGTGDDGAAIATLYRYRPVALTLDGPQASESGSPNPFLDYRFDVTFTAPSGETLEVPGYFAADGEAALTGATAGPTWRALLTPSEAGTWSYEVSFRSGAGVAVADGPDPGSALAPYHGLEGSFQVAPEPAGSPGNYARGPLRYVGERYLRFANGEPLLKGGADSPENLLAYADFDNTYDNQGGSVKSWSAHRQDWEPGDPTWGGDRGKGLIGALNYLAAEGMNAFSFIPFTAPQGDGKDVWPWLEPDEPLRYDVSKLAQWDVVFSHADRLGMFLHFKTQETENDRYLDGGQLGTERKLYYRELVARFGYHMALNWNLGEENDLHQELDDPALDVVQSHAAYFEALDPYRHPIVIHTYPDDHEAVYGELVDDPTMTGASIQLPNMYGGHGKTLEWIQRSEEAGEPWHVALDEPGNATTGVTCDGPGNNYRQAREEALWANLMAGGTGVEWYFGYQTCAGDLAAEDWRTRDRLWDYTRYALTFFREHLPFTEMQSADALTPEDDDYVFAQTGLVYAVYDADAHGTELELPAAEHDFVVRWYDPRAGGTLQTGTVAAVAGGGRRDLGEPPSDAGRDWVVLVTAPEEAVPVELSRFEAVRDGDAVLLHWTTASETNNAGFDVEHQAPAADAFWTVAHVEGAGTTTEEQRYSHRAERLAAGTHRFRLRQVDFDGTSSYSPVVEVEVTAPRAFTLAENYPNPFTGSTRIRFTVPEAGRATLAVYDVTGRHVATLFDRVAHPDMPHAVTFDADALAGGVYTYVLEHDGRRLTRTMLVVQ